MLGNEQAITANASIRFHHRLLLQIVMFIIMLIKKFSRLKLSFLARMIGIPTETCSCRTCSHVVVFWNNFYSYSYQDYLNLAFLILSVKMLPCTKWLLGIVEDVSAVLVWQLSQICPLVFYATSGLDSSNNVKQVHMQTSFNQSCDQSLFKFASLF